MCRHNPYRIPWSLIGFNGRPSLRSFLRLPLIEHFQRDDVDTMARRVLGFRGRKAKRADVAERGILVPWLTQKPLLTPVKLGHRPTRTIPTRRNPRSKTPFTQPGLVIRIVLIIPVFSIIKNNKSLLPGEHLITYSEKVTPGLS